MYGGKGEIVCTVTHPNWCIFWSWEIPCPFLSQWTTFILVLSTCESPRAAIPLCVSTKTHCGPTIQIHGKWWQRRTKTRSNTSGVYDPFHSLELLYLIYVRQMGFRWFTYPVLQGHSRKDFHILPAIRQGRVYQPQEVLATSPLFPTWSPCLKLRGQGVLFFQPSVGPDSSQPSNFT